MAALERWPVTGVPDNPGAWLMATAKHRATDELRRARLVKAKHEMLAGETEIATTPSFEEDADDDVGDDLLRLVFVACHPVLAREAQLALTLRLLGGLSTAEIARAFLVPEPTIAQRIVRAKRTLVEKQIPFEVPRGEDLGPRLASVLEVVYLVFNEGYSATAGEDWMRPALCADALRLGRVLAELVPAEPDVHALVSLMEIQVSRTAARTPGRRARAAPRSGPQRVGPRRDSTWSRCARACGRAGGSSLHRLRGAGEARSMSCARTDRGRDGVAAHRCALHGAGGGRTQPGRRAESSRGARHGIWAQSRPLARRCHCRRSGAIRLSPLAECPRRLAGEARTHGGGLRRLRTGSRPHEKRA